MLLLLLLLMMMMMMMMIIMTEVLLRCPSLKQSISIVSGVAPSLSAYLSVGVKGPKEFLNGTYDPVGILNGKPLFRKRGDDSRWLRYTLKGTHWMISDTANKGA